MAQAVNQAIVANEAIISKIYLNRGQKVMMDRDLAELYGVETKQLKRQVKRNIDRFPEDLMFELNEENSFIGGAKMAPPMKGIKWVYAKRTNYSKYEINDVCPGGCQPVA